MNLYDYLTQKMYNNILYHNYIAPRGEAANKMYRKENFDNADKDDDGHEDEDDENEMDNEKKKERKHLQRRKAKVFPRSLLTGEMECDESESEESEIRSPRRTNTNASSDWDNTLQCKNDLVIRQNYEKYQFLKKRPNARKAQAEHRAYFDKILSRINRLKLIVGSVATMFLSYNLSFDLLILKSLPISTDKIRIQGETFDVQRLLQASSFAGFCFFLTAGFRLALWLTPSRNRFCLQYDTTFFIIFLNFFIHVLIELAQALVIIFSLPICLPFLMSIKSLLVGFLAVYLLYALFDCQITVIRREEAKGYVRYFFTSIILGLILALAIDNGRMDQIVLSIFCHLFLSASFSVVFLLLWYGIAHLHQYTIINSRNRTEFGFYFSIKTSPRQCITLNCICFAVQSARRYSDHLAEDNCSVRTVKPWRRNCITFIGVILFVAAFSSLFFHLIFSFLWFDDYFPGCLQEWQTILIRCIFIILLLWGVKVEHCLTSIIVAWHNHYKRDPLEPKIRPDSSQLHFSKLVITYLLTIIANVAQLFVTSFGFKLVLIINMAYGISLGLMCEYLPRFIGKFITITEVTVCLTIIGSVSYSSLASMMLYHLVERTGSHLQWLYYLNLITAFISLNLIVAIAKLQCLRSTNGFDLMKMKPLKVVEHHSNNNPQQPPVIHIEGSTPNGSHAGSVKSTRGVIDRTPKSNSISSFYLYQMAIDTSHLTSEHLENATHPPAVVPYRLKFRISSIASILSNRKNSSN